MRARRWRRDIMRMRGVCYKYRPFNTYVVRFSQLNKICTKWAKKRNYWRPQRKEMFRKLR